MNRFKALDLVNRVPEELWIESCNIVQEAEKKKKIISKKKKSKKAKWLSGYRRLYKYLKKEEK